MMKKNIPKMETINQEMEVNQKEIEIKKLDKVTVIAIPGFRLANYNKLRNF